MSDIEKLESVYKSIILAAEDYRAEAEKPRRNEILSGEFAARSESFATVGEWLREVVPELKGGE